MTKVLDKKFEKEITEITGKIVKNYKPEKIILFGSAASGNLTTDSDADFFIIKRTEDDFFKRCINVRRIIRDKGIPVDIIVYTPEETKKRYNMGDFFVREILDEGKILYEKQS